MNVALLLNDLRRDEGWRGSAYQDNSSEKLWTIGYGFMIDERKRGVVPRAIGEQWLELAATEKWLEILQRQPWLRDVDEDVQRALANMAYQLGAEGVCKFELMLAALQRGDREAAALNALDSAWAKQAPKRAARVADLIRGHTAEGDDNG